MRLAERDCWIFDMDGTLTIAQHDFEAIRRELGIAPGRPILEEIATRPAAEADLLMAELGRIERAIACESTAQPGARELLLRLQEREDRVGILTRNSESIALETLRACGLLEFFPHDCIVGRETSAPKPEPDGLLELLRRWRARPQSAVMVGDFRYDMLAGRAARVATVYLDVEQTREWEEHADLRATSLHELVELLDTMRA